MAATHKNFVEWSSNFTEKFCNQNTKPPTIDVPFVLSTVASPKIYVSVEECPKNNVLGKHNPAKSLGIIDGTQITGTDDRFLLYFTGRPDWYIYVEGSYVKVRNEYPGPEGQWKITYIGKDLQGNPKIMLSTDNSMYMYMQNTGDYCVMSSTIRPGDEGIFIAEKPY